MVFSWIILTGCQPHFRITVLDHDRQFQIQGISVKVSDMGVNDIVNQVNGFLFESGIKSSFHFVISSIIYFFSVVFSGIYAENGSLL